MRELVPLTASITASVASALNTLTDPLDAGRHNLVPNTLGVQTLHTRTSVGRSHGDYAC